MPAFDAIALFVKTVDQGSFAAAASNSGLTASAAARIVSRLETQLGARLLHRSTRRLVLTQEGERYLPHARAAVAAMAAGEAELAACQGRLQGLIRVNTGSAFARHKLAPWLPAFHAQYPGVSLDLRVSDLRIDPEPTQVDVTVRVGPLEDSGLILKPLGTVRRVIVASPAYLARAGTPRTPADLLQHNCLLLNGATRLSHWPLFQDGQRVLLPVTGAMRSDSADLLHDLALAGLGIVRLGDFLGEKALANGQLVPLLTEHHDADPTPISVLVLPGRQHLARVRAFLSFLDQVMGSAAAGA